MSRTFLFKVISIGIGILFSLCLVEIFLRVQDFMELDGFAEKHPWNPVLHHGGDSFVVETNGAGCTEGKIRVLLLGDSWMEDPILSGTIGQELAAITGQCVQTFNGGTSSYSPTIYLLKGRQAFQKYGKFDYVIVNIDETDIGDEWLRYRIPLTRDTTGRIVSVPFEKDIRSLFIWNGKLWAEDSFFYFMRLIKFAFFHKVLFPYLEYLTVAPNHYETLMKYVFSPDASSSFAAEKEYFYNRLAEMAKELAGVTHGASSVYVTHHPHLRGLVKDVEEGKTYLPIVSDAVSRLGQETGVRVLDARNHIRQIHGDGFPLNTYKDGDPFSHLGSEGAKRYGHWIAERVSVDGYREKSN